MDFKIFSEEQQKHAKEMFERSTILYSTKIDRDEIFEVYLDSYRPEDNKMFRERREMDCSCCRSFIRQAGGVVAIEDGKLITLWDFEPSDEKYKPMVKAMREYVKSKPIEGVFYFEDKSVGTKISRERLESGEVIEWNHFFLGDIPSKFICKDFAKIKGEKQTERDLLEKFLRIDKEHVENVLGLIEDNNLYKGENYVHPLNKLNLINRKILNSNEKEKDIELWEWSSVLTPMECRLINTTLGELLQNLQRGDGIEVAVKKYEDMVAPENYKRAKPIFTARQKEMAIKTIQELGYKDSLRRRYGKFNDLNVRNALFLNREAKESLDLIDNIFDNMDKKTSNAFDKNSLENLPSITLREFLEERMSKANSIEMLFENKLRKNLVSLLTSVEPEAKSMFKWNNNFSWNYNGDLAGASTLKENVKKAGGDVEGFLRFSLQWNDGEIYNKNDFDAHCIMDDTHRLFFGTPMKRIKGGVLDVDIISPKKGVPAVENITFETEEKLESTKYDFFVKNFDRFESEEGFNAEIEIDGVIYEYHYDKPLRGEERVQVATVIKKGDGYEVIHHLPNSKSSVETWGISTNKFVEVKAITNSPNHWGENKVGSKHIFFMLKGCRNNDKASPFYNEFLNDELVGENRRFMEALRSELRVEDNLDGEQLSGLGFLTSEREEIILKIDGQITKVII